jgi:hypothetical protein
LKLVNTDSVADRVCLSRIPDPKTATKEKGEKVCCPTFFCSNKYQKVKSYFIILLVMKKLWSNLQRIIESFTQKIVIMLSKIWVWDSGSGKHLFRIPDPEVKKAPDPGSGSATLNTDKKKSTSDHGMETRAPCPLIVSVVLYLFLWRLLVMCGLSPAPARQLAFLRWRHQLLSSLVFLGVFQSLFRFSSFCSFLY